MLGDSGNLSFLDDDIKFLLYMVRNGWNVLKELPPELFLGQLAILAELLDQQVQASLFLADDFLLLLLPL